MTLDYIDQQKIIIFLESYVEMLRKVNSSSSLYRADAIEDLLWRLKNG